MYGYNPQELSLTCLIQLMYAGKCYIIDVLIPEVWKEVTSTLKSIMSDPNVIKIGHGISFDVRALSRDFNLHICNVFDTYEASKVLGLEEKGLAKVCSYYGLEEGEEYKRLKGMWQTCDWKRRPMEEGQVRTVELGGDGGRCIAFLTFFF